MHPELVLELGHFAVHLDYLVRVKVQFQLLLLYPVCYFLLQFTHRVLHILICNPSLQSFATVGNLPKSLLLCLSHVLNVLTGGLLDQLG